MAIKEEISCPICKHEKYTRINTSGRDYFKVSFAICPNCGFAYQNPRWTKDSIIKFYETSYDKFYRSKFVSRFQTEEEYEQSRVGFNPLYHRIKPFVDTSRELNVLDIGSGDGSNISFLGKKLGAKNLYAIEPSKYALTALKMKNIEVLSNDVDSDWYTNLSVKFDVITLRHVFEHLHYPNKFLQMVRSILNEDGILYLAVPDTYNLAAETFSREYARIVHNYYFTKNSLRNILVKNGFEIKVLQDGDHYHNAELFVVATISKTQEEVVVDKDEHDRQLAYLQPFIDRDKTIGARLSDFIFYLRRRIYYYKVSLKIKLGLIK